MKLALKKKKPECMAKKNTMITSLGAVTAIMTLKGQQPHPALDTQQCICTTSTKCSHNESNKSSWHYFIFQEYGLFILWCW
jgi:hypothetical protein